MSDVAPSPASDDDAHVNRSADVTRLLHDAATGDARSSAQLMPLVYEQLRRSAQKHMNRERPDHTLDATALVHEAYLRLVGDQDGSWASRAHLYHATGEAMRRILIDRARERGALKRGGNWRRLVLDPNVLTIDEVPGEVLTLDEALAALSAHAPRAAELVKLRFFRGLSHQAAALAMGISTNTADRDWTFAKAWLFRYLAGAEGSAGQPAP